MRLIQLAEQCVNRLDGAPIVRVESSIHPVLNAHPSPMLQHESGVVRADDRAIGACVMGLLWGVVFV